MNAEVYDDFGQTLEELLRSGKTGEYLSACGIEEDSAGDFAQACCEDDEAVRVLNLQNFFANEIAGGKYLTIMFFVKALGQMFGTEFLNKFGYEFYWAHMAALEANDSVAATSIAEFCEANGIRYKQ
ncbi:MAG: hypothetical protein V2A63_03700 [Patescibacteria group bacterium]